MATFVTADVSEVPSELNLKELNKAFKSKWVEMIETKSDLYEVESKIINLHRDLMKNKFILLDGERSQLEDGSMLEKRVPEIDKESNASKDEQDDQKNVRFSKDTTKVLKDWFLQNIKHPYPKYFLLTLVTRTNCTCRR